jgi:catechol 2,3-dioxygenase-like lactoylglutathione lyase family enzyme
MPTILRVRHWPAIVRCSIALVALLCAGQSAHSAVTRLEQIIVTVSDLRRTEQFFQRGLGFTTVARGRLDGEGFARLVGLRNANARSITMRLGSDEVVFVQYGQTGKPYPADSRSPDLWFQHFAIVVSNMDRAYQVLHHVPFRPISEGPPVTLQPGNGSIKAFKFRDPDGHPLELLAFPPGQGRQIWHLPAADGVFLGIDHSAIAVSDTDRSVTFYRDLLGMTIDHQTINRGPTQESLDGTFDAIVHVTGLRTASPAGPGIEFLEYYTPPTGRPFSRETRSNDLTHLELKLAVANLDELVARLRAAHVAFVSPDVVNIGSGRRAAMVRDPDGHALLLDEEAETSGAPRR